MTETKAKKINIPKKVLTVLGIIFFGTSINLFLCEKAYEPSLNWTTQTIGIPNKHNDLIILAVFLTGEAYLVWLALKVWKL
ncbi:MAG: hypothetical protein ACRCXZ_01175 [Patescibacteria group bacterium]